MILTTRVLVTMVTDTNKIVPRGAAADLADILTMADSREGRQKMADTLAENLESIWLLTSRPDGASETTFVGLGESA